MGLDDLGTSTTLESNKSHAQMRLPCPQSSQSPTWLTTVHSPLSEISTIATMVCLSLPVYPLLHIDRVGPPGAYHLIPSTA